MFDAMRTTQDFYVTVWGDDLAEGEEALTVSLSGLVNAVMGDGDAVGTITDNDASFSPTKTSSQRVHPTALRAVPKKTLRKKKP